MDKVDKVELWVTHISEQTHRATRANLRRPMSARPEEDLAYRDLTLRALADNHIVLPHGGVMRRNMIGDSANPGAGNRA